MQKSITAFVLGMSFFTGSANAHPRHEKCPDDEKLRIVKSEKGGKIKTVGTYSYMALEDSKDAKIQMYLHKATFMPNGTYGLWTRTGNKMPCYVRGIFRIKAVDSLFLDGPFMFVYLENSTATKDLEVLAMRIGSVLETYLGATPAKSFTALKTPVATP